MTKDRLAAATLGLVAFFLFPATGTPAKATAEFVWLSDLHFDPTANPGLVDALAAARVEEWPRILASGQPAAFSKFGEDTNWALLSSSLDAIKKTAIDPRFTVVTGDILVHHFREKFAGAATNHDEEAFERFARRTMQFLAAQLANIAPGKPVLLTLGNNDSDCGDYQLQPHGAFLKDGSASIAKLLGSVADEAASVEWSALGSYSVRHPAVKHYRVIALNSVYFSPKYRNACSNGAGDPAQEEMKWLETKLAEAKQHNDKVWLIFHIPPGIDGFSTSHPKGGGPNKIVWMWKPNDTEEFAKLLSEYHDTVTVSLAGHEHMDDFRLISHSLVLCAPGLSPVVGQNPAFRVAAFGPDGTIRDEKTYYLSNLETASGTTGADWKLEYSFAGTWNARRLDFKNFSRMYDEMAAKPAPREQWATWYSVSRQELSAQSSKKFAWLFCASGNATEETYKACIERMNGVSAE